MKQLELSEYKKKHPNAKLRRLDMRKASDRALGKKAVAYKLHVFPRESYYIQA